MGAQFEATITQLTEQMKPAKGQAWASFEQRAAVCPAHQRLLVPHGLLALVGNPNLPDGLELVTASRGPPRVPV